MSGKFLLKQWQKLTFCDFEYIEKIEVVIRWNKEKEKIEARPVHPIMEGYYINTFMSSDPYRAVGWDDYKEMVLSIVEKKPLKVEIIVEDDDVGFYLYRDIKNVIEFFIGKDKCEIKKNHNKTQLYN